MRALFAKSIFAKKGQQRLTCSTDCWYLSYIRELLEGTLEHQTLHAGLAQCNLPDSILGNLRNTFP